MALQSPMISKLGLNNHHLSANELRFKKSYGVVGWDLVSNRKTNHFKAPLIVRCERGREGHHHQEFQFPPTTTVIDQPPLPIVTPKTLNKSHFPPNFGFGASTSALQTEGPGNEGGRGKSTWDFMIQGKQAVDSYHLYKEDVRLLKEMGLNTYRFSIAWPRILPNGTIEGGINQEGIDFYNNLLDELEKNNITPYVTLFHFDMPFSLVTYGGFLNKQIVTDFKNYADLCYEKFGDRVKHWTTINEPFVYGAFGYKMGLPEAMKSNPLNPYIATHNIILAHAAATKLYREKYQNKQRGEMGISLVCKWFEPHSDDPEDIEGAQRALDFVIGWYMDPLTRGDYPSEMKKFVEGLPKFTKEEKKMVKGAFDFIGVNYYTSRYVKPTVVSGFDQVKGHTKFEYIEEKVDRNGLLIGHQAEGQADIYVYPIGLREVLLYMKNKYNVKKLYVTENGVPSKPTISVSVKDAEKERKQAEIDKALNDDYRIEHMQDHLHAVYEARRAGANVLGFFVWTLMDNMEVGAGYDVRFGLNFVDYFDNHKRYPKKSAEWFKSFLSEK